MFNVTGGGEGCFMRLSNINKVPEGHVAANYICRKNFYPFNVLIFVDYIHRILDMQYNMPGSFHDATTCRCFSYEAITGGIRP